MKIEAVFSHCGCHTNDDHQKVRLTADGHTVLDCCLNVLWLMMAMKCPERTAKMSPLTYSWDFLLKPPSLDWHAALDALDD